MKKYTQKLLKYFLIFVCFFLFTLQTAYSQYYAAPPSYDGVMFQGFYWDSFSANGKTWWEGLTDQSDEIAKHFDLIWLPPSGNANGTKESPQMGYHPIYYFDHNSSFGTQKQLKTLIETLRAKGCGAIADIVINHRNGVSNWTDFPIETYKENTYTWGLETICADDEVKDAPGQQPGQGAMDEGDNWDGARDIDHTKEVVQTTIKAYLDFMKNEMGYIGWRYDLVKGYAGYYVGMYNKSAKCDFSVGECWDNYDKITEWIDKTKLFDKEDDVIRSGAFDFSLKYALNDACNNSQWDKLRWNYNNQPQPAGLIHNPNFNRFSYTFVDNHDTYREDHGKVKYNILPAYAFILSHPGIPCVFYTHWDDNNYKEKIKQMIDLRKLVGIHSQSNVKVYESAGDIYAAEIYGTRGSLYIKVGTRYPYTPSDKTYGNPKITGDNFAIWSKVNFEQGNISVNALPIIADRIETIKYDGTGTNFINWTPKCHIHAWLVPKPGESFTQSYSTPWAECNSDTEYENLDPKLKMTHIGANNSGQYEININLKEFFNVETSDLEKIGKLGIVVRTQYKGNTNQTINFLLNVTNSSFTWLGNTNEWNNAANWSNFRIPDAAGKVVIPAMPEDKVYPTIPANTIINTITIQADAEIANQQNLIGDYKAFVEYDFSKPSTRDRWNMLSIPLQEVYPADFVFGGYPKTLIRKFNPQQYGSITQAGWDNIQANDNPFKAGDSFIYWLYGQDNNMSKGLGLTNGILQIPYFENTSLSAVHHTHDFTSNINGNILGKSTFYNFRQVGEEYERIKEQNYKVSRSTNAYKLANSSISESLIFGEHNGLQTSITLVGNPFVSTINFSSLIEDNSSKIKDSYQVWTGKGYSGYTPLGSFGTTDLNEYIAPMQAFIVEKAETYNENDKLDFDISLCSGTTGKGSLKSAAALSGKLEITTSNQTGSVKTFIAKHDRGQSSVGDMDVRKLINNITDIPEVYTLKESKIGKVALGANVINSDSLTIPIGLITTYTGDIKLTISGMDTYPQHVTFIDTQEKKEINLSGKQSHEYVFNHTPIIKSGQVNATDDRFFIRIASSKATEENSIETPTQFNVYTHNHTVYIKSKSDDPIKKVQVYNLHGSLIYKNNNINSSYYTIEHIPSSGIYFIKIISEKNRLNRKIIIE